MNNQDPGFDVARRGLVLMAVFAVACGDSSSTSQTGTTGTTGTTGAATTEPTPTSEGTSVPTTGGTGTATGTGTSSGGTTEGITSATTGTSTGPTPTTGPGTGDTSTGDTGTGDTGTGDTSTGEMGCGGFESLDFSYIWIANSAQSTISKIDTKTGDELGRYATNAAPTGNKIGGPSRTSVSVLGDVVVADRQGWLVKFYAREDRCIDNNGNGTIETSTSAAPLPYGQDECLAWAVELKSSFPAPAVGEQPGPRVAQWTIPSECNGDDSKVWVGWCDEQGKPAIQLRDGSDGALIYTYDLGFECFNDIYGPYGGVVDEVNDLWVAGRTGPNNPANALYNIAFNCDPNQDQCVTKYAPPLALYPYGINIAGDGRIWMTGYPDQLVVFDPMTSMWADHTAAVNAALPPGDNLLRGLVVEKGGAVWMALGNHQVDIGPNPRLIRVDPSMNPVAVQSWGPETITELKNPVGMSIDVDGYLWLVDSAANKAYEIDPTDPTKYTVVGGLVTPYTYSDMTGYALSLVVPQ